MLKLHEYRSLASTGTYSGHVSGSSISLWPNFRVETKPCPECGDPNPLIPYWKTLGFYVHLTITVLFIYSYRLALKNLLFVAGNGEFLQHECPHAEDGSLICSIGAAPWRAYGHLRGFESDFGIGRKITYGAGTSQIGDIAYLYTFLLYVCIPLALVTLLTKFWKPASVNKWRFRIAVILAGIYMAGLVYCGVWKI